MNPTNYPTSARASSARGSDARASNARISNVPRDYLDPHPWRWLGAFACAIVFYFLVLATAGSLING